MAETPSKEHEPEEVAPEPPEESPPDDDEAEPSGLVAPDDAQPTEADEDEELEGYPVEAAAGFFAYRSWIGPLPPPGALERYNEVVRDGAERIVAQWEQQSAHRQSLEDRVVTSNIGAERRGQWMAFTIYCFGLLFAVVMATIGYVWLGFGAFLLETIALAYAFISEKRSSQGALRRKAERIEADESNVPDTAPKRDRLESP